MLMPDIHDGADTAMTDPEAEYEVLVRCTQGESKFSARVSRAVCDGDWARGDETRWEVDR